MAGTAVDASVSQPIPESESADSVSEEGAQESKDLAKRADTVTKDTLSRGSSAREDL